MNKKVIKSEHQVIRKGSMIDFCVDTITLSDNKSYTREYVKHPGAVAILPFLDNDQIILENNYRHPFNKTLIEIPAGKLEPNERIEEAALRELEEETGYKANTIIPVGSMIPVGAYSTEIIYFFVAYNLEKTKTNQDEDEMLETFVTSFDEAIKLILEDKINDAKTISLLLKVKLLRDLGKFKKDWFI